jgi:hypothetical protein
VASVELLLTTIISRAVSSRPADASKLSKSRLKLAARLCVGIKTLTLWDKITSPVDETVVLAL